MPPAPSHSPDPAHTLTRMHSVPDDTWHLEPQLVADRRTPALATIPRTRACR